ncbi:putative GMC oxidoreductase [Hypoxylon sp. FL1284]|nr:putative GMC oxidoreductase [Hypoxylon sp. FL1284]
MEVPPFDFVIIGGGTAGLVVARRLSEDPSQRILVLEAGSDHTGDPRVDTPAIFKSLFGTEADWDFVTEPQPNLNGRSIPLNQGKMLGGSSAINAHIFVPPSKGVIDAWGALGNEGWNWDSLQKYFAKVYASPSADEAFKKSLGLDNWNDEDGSESRHGPIKTSFSGHLNHPIRAAWAEAFEADPAGMARDPFHDPSVKCFSALTSIHPESKERSYSVSAYYDPVRDRENLQVLTNAVVEKILFDNDDPPRAIGVRYAHDGETKTVYVDKEVVLAAGTLQSPKVLELSGVGDRAVLEKHGIDVVQYLPQVGENLQDHLVCYISYEVADDVETLDKFMTREPGAIEQAQKEYAETRTGLLSSVGFYTYAYVSLLQAVGSDDQEHLKALIRAHRPPAGTLPEQERARAYHDVAECALLSATEPSGAYLTALVQMAPTDMQPAPGKFISLGVMLSHPVSRGSVHITSNLARDAPIVDPRYLSDGLDVEVLARHLQHMDGAIAGSRALARLLKQPLRRLDPASENLNLDRARAYARDTAVSIWHPAGTCAMLPRDRGGVVDARLRVYGTIGLRVVDASAVPLLSTANPQATVYTFAERAADLIKEAYGLK